MEPATSPHPRDPGHPCRPLDARRQVADLLVTARRLLRSEAEAISVVREAAPSGRFGVIAAAVRRVRTLLPHTEAGGTRPFDGFTPDGAWAEPPQAGRADLDAALASPARIRIALDRLPEPCRLIVLLRDVERLDVREIATLLDWTADAVKIALHRGRQRLHVHLRELGCPDRGCGTGAAREAV